MSLRAFARELLLDTSECESACFMIPPLSRDSFSRKGIFYRTEKIIVKNYGKQFSLINSSTRVKEAICYAYDVLVEDHFNPSLALTI